MSRPSVSDIVRKSGVLPRGEFNFIKFWDYSHLEDHASYGIDQRDRAFAIPTYHVGYVFFWITCPLYASPLIHGGLKNETLYSTSLNRLLKKDIYFMNILFMKHKPSSRSHLELYLSHAHNYIVRISNLNISLSN